MRVWLVLVLKQGRSAEGNDRDGRNSSSTLGVNVTAPPSTPSSLLTPAGEGGGGVPSTNITGRGSGPPVSKPTDLDVMLKREVFFSQKYDPMTGVRIASTLGGFFLIVLLTLLYKSKCKGKHSREPSMVSPPNVPYPSYAAGHLMRGQNIQVNGPHDFGGGTERNDGCSGGPDSPVNPMSLTQLDSCYGYMNQVHPTNSHTPIFSNCYTGAEGHVKSPAVLLITSANSESSDEELSVMSGIDQRQHPHHHHHSHGGEVPPERKRLKIPIESLSSCRQVLNVGRQTGSIVIESHRLHPRSNSPPFGGIDRAKQGIDINVILPTPSISPSGSENFSMAAAQYFGGGGGPSGSAVLGNSSNCTNNPTLALFPSGAVVGPGIATGAGRGETRRLLVSRSLSSDNDNSEMSDVGGPCGGDLSECSDPAMLPFGCGNSFFSLDNLKYVDDTSSENIPTRASDADEQDPDHDTRSIGSDSVFACFDHNFDHVAPTYARRVSSVSGTSSGVLVVHSGAPGRVSPQPLQRTNSNASAAPRPELLKVSSIGCGENGSGSGAPASSSSGCVPNSGSGGGCESEETEFRVTLTQAHAQVHHRDSFCSDLESVNDYMETGARRRSSSTQTTLSDLRQALGYSPLIGRWSGYVGTSFDGGVSPGATSLMSYTAHERKLSVPRRRRSLSPHLSVISGAGGTHLLSPTTPLATSNSSPPFLSVTLHPPPPQPPPTLSLDIATSAGESVDGEDATPTNPPSSTNMMTLSPTAAINPSSAFVPPRMMRKRSFEAVRKSLSLQCEEKGDASSLYVSSSNETTPTN